MNNRHDEPYNPLSMSEIGESIVRALIERPCVPLPEMEDVLGAGIYALYYRGDFAHYEPIAEPDCVTPIYVGSAEPPGAQVENAPAGPELRNRLREHRNSIADAENLDVDDFRCRYLVVDDIWITLGNRVLTQRFQPVWNSVATGFAQHNPGASRYGGLRSDWDEIHPGRPWRDEMNENRTAEAVLAEVRVHLARHAG